MSAIDNIQKNIELLWEKFKSPLGHSSIENEIERLEGEKGTIKINLRKINEIERIESITIPQDYESSYFLGRKIALQDQIDNNKKTLALIKEL